MRFWNYKSEEFYDIYVKIYDSNFPLEKKKSNSMKLTDTNIREKNFHNKL